ncbi:MAG: helix-hairpin-helix domain-containing protein [Candidatus Binatota bacterium]
MTPPLPLRRNSNALFLLQRVRDEAYRFAITYHKKLRTRQTLYSALDKIPGIGGARKRALLRHFGSIKRIEEATVKDLLQVPFMNEKIAQEIIDTLRSAP